MLQNNFPQENNEHIELATLQERVQMCKSEPFKDLKRMLDGLIDEAHEGIIGCLSSDPQAHMRLLIRYQQRVAVRREIERWQENAEKEFTDITEAMRNDLERAAQELN